MKTRTIRQTVTLPASPRIVFKALADSKQHSAFTGSKAKIPKRAGGGWKAFYWAPLRRYLTRRSAK